jgi:hypothetical protein
MVTSIVTGSKHPINLEMRWNFGDSRSTFLSLDEFLAQKEADGVEFFAGKEPWLKGLRKLSWQTFFRVCTEEMDDLSQKAIKLVIEYCLEVLEEVEETIRGKASLARLEAALNLQYAEQYENKVFQYRWALRHPVVNEAITRAMGKPISLALGRGDLPTKVPDSDLVFAPEFLASLILTLAWSMDTSTFNRPL